MLRRYVIRPPRDRRQRVFKQKDDIGQGLGSTIRPNGASNYALKTLSLMIDIIIYM